MVLACLVCVMFVVCGVSVSGMHVMFVVCGISVWCACDGVCGVSMSDVHVIFVVCGVSVSGVHVMFVVLACLVCMCQWCMVTVC